LAEGLSTEEVGNEISKHTPTLGRLDARADRYFTRGRNARETGDRRTDLALPGLPG